MFAYFCVHRKCQFHVSSAISLPFRSMLFFLLDADRLSQLRYRLLLACVVAQIPFFFVVVVVGSPKKIVVMCILMSLTG